MTAPPSPPRAAATPRRASAPLVLLPACNRVLGGHPFHIVGAKYVAAVRLAGCRPLLVPEVQADEIDALLALADGVLLTGSPSNVHPRHFGQPLHDATLPLDEGRDAWTLPLVRAALARGLPLLGICRGAQEINVALGGSLHQAVHETGVHETAVHETAVHETAVHETAVHETAVHETAIPETSAAAARRYADHRSDPAAPVEAQYAAAHDIELTPGGRLARIAGDAPLRVNSLHGQAVARLAPGLRVEARAPDGLIEAFSADGDGFAVGVQWHPEWQAAQQPLSQRLFAAFGQACAAWRDAHRGASPVDIDTARGIDPPNRQPQHEP